MNVQVKKNVFDTQFNICTLEEFLDIELTEFQKLLLPVIQHADCPHELRGMAKKYMPAMLPSTLSKNTVAVDWDKVSDPDALAEKIKNSSLNKNIVLIQKSVSGKGVYALFRTLPYQNEVEYQKFYFMLYFLLTAEIGHEIDSLPDLGRLRYYSPNELYYLNEATVCPFEKRLDFIPSSRFVTNNKDENPCTGTTGQFKRNEVKRGEYTNDN